MKILLVFFAVLISLQASNACISGSHSVDFRYEHSSSWHDNFDFCAGRSQSPIDLNYCQTIEDKPITYSGHWDVRPFGFTIQNTNTTAEISFSGRQPLISDDLLNSTYTFSQMHFHWGLEEEGSEHAINDSYYGMEAHMVHYRTDYGSVEEALEFSDGLVVIAILFEISEEDNAELNDIINGLSLIQEAGSSAKLPSKSMTWLEPHLMSHKDFLAYQGSLTTPPCSEVVSWFVLHGTVYISRNQLKQFRRIQDPDGNLILANRRPLQFANQRRIVCTTT